MLKAQFYFVNSEKSRIFASPKQNNNNYGSKKH